MKHLFAIIVLFLFSFTAFENIPFDRDKKPTPVGTNWKNLIPPLLNNFERISFKEPQGGKDGSAYYKKGKQVIFVSFIKLGSEKDVKNYLEEAKADVMQATAETRNISLSGKNKFVYYRQPEKCLFAWNNGTYYFDVLCEGDLSALDEFMAAFPY
jgi:hypothetical protein